MRESIAEDIQLRDSRHPDIVGPASDRLTTQNMWPDSRHFAIDAEGIRAPPGSRWTFAGAWSRTCSELPPRDCFARPDVSARRVLWRRSARKPGSEPGRPGRSPIGSKRCRLGPEFGEEEGSGAASGRFALAATRAPRPVAMATFLHRPPSPGRITGRGLRDTSFGRPESSSVVGKSPVRGSPLRDALEGSCQSVSRPARLTGWAAPASVWVATSRVQISTRCSSGSSI